MKSPKRHDFGLSAKSGWGPLIIKTGKFKIVGDWERAATLLFLYHKSKLLRSTTGT